MTGPSDETDMRCAWMSSWVRSAMRPGGPPRGSLTRHLRGERPTGRHDRNRHVCAWCCHARGRATAYVPLELSVTCDGGPYRTEYPGLPVATRWRGGAVSSFQFRDGACWTKLGPQVEARSRRSTSGWVLYELAVGLGADARCWPRGAGRTAMQDGCGRGVVQCSVEKRSGEKRKCGRSGSCPHTGQPKQGGKQRSMTTSSIAKNTADSLLSINTPHPLSPVITCQFSSSSGSCPMPMFISCLASGSDALDSTRPPCS